MDQDLKKLLEDNLALNKENNFILNKLYGAYKLNRVINVVKWIFVIGFALGVFYFIEPLFNQMFSIYGLDSSEIKNMLVK